MRDPFPCPNIQKPPPRDARRRRANRSVQRRIAIGRAASIAGEKGVPEEILGFVKALIVIGCEKLDIMRSTSNPQAHRDLATTVRPARDID
jgi:hypothetical protein